jgi:hypothetical protein
MSDDAIRHCEVPGCPNPAGYGLRVCEQHLREPATPKDRAEALAYLRERLARYERLWPDPDTADSLALHGSYDIAALRLVLTGSRHGEARGGRVTFETVYCEVDDDPAAT